MFQNLFKAATALDTKIFTTYGEIGLSRVLPGDEVLSALDGHLMKVGRVVELGPANAVEVTYSDGRKSTYSYEQEIVYGTNPVHGGYNIGKVKDLVAAHVNRVKNYNTFSEIPMSDHIDLDLEEVWLGRGLIGEGSMPLEPYIAGIFLIYGDRKDPYLNLPIISRVKADIPEFKLIETYLEDHNGMIGNIKVDHYIHREISGKIYFYGDRNTLLKWVDVFGQTLVRLVPNMCEYPIPPCYFYTEKQNRIKFIRGVNDYGCKVMYNPTEMGIVGDTVYGHETTFLAFKDMLQSIGVASSLRIENFDVQSWRASPEYNRVVLEYIGGVSTALFYKPSLIDAAAKMYTADRFKHSCMEHYELRIESIRKVQGKFKAFELQLAGEDAGACYLTAGFLPRPSMPK